VTNTIWVLTSDYIPGIGGEENQIRWFCQELQSTRWQPRIITRRHGWAHLEGVGKDESIDNVPVRRVYSKGAGKLGSVFYLLNGLSFLAKQNTGDIIQVHGIHSQALLGLVYSKLFRKKLIIKLRSGNLTYERLLASPLRKAWLSILLRNSASIICLNSPVKEFLTKHFQFNTPLYLIPNGIKTDEFEFTSHKVKKQRRRELGLKTTDTLFLFIGRLERVKRVDIILNAFAQIYKSYETSPKLMVVGDGSQSESLQALSVTLGIEDYVIFFSYDPNVKKYYQAADISILASETEGVSLTMLEAMASGVPMLHSQVGGAVDFIENNVNGLLFKPGKVQACAEAFHKILSIKDQWPSLAKSARETVLENADMKSIVAQYEKIYQGLNKKPAK
jgi:glycosyltransferase involved in cell wall biosynthesis